VPKLEPWLWLMIAAFVPTAIIPFVPRTTQVPLAIAAGVLLVAGLAILVVRHKPVREHPVEFENEQS
jgi:hypothetical protein